MTAASRSDDTDVEEVVGVAEVLAEPLDGRLEGRLDALNNDPQLRRRGTYVGWKEEYLVM